ncbi:recombinase family protein [Brevibacterium rongguiense]
MSVYGYARVSTADQNPQLQLDALTAAGIDAEHTFTDKASGASPDRPALSGLMATLTAGDTLVVWKFDRLGRSTPHLVGLLDELGERGVDFRSLTDPIDTSAPAQASRPRVRRASRWGASPRSNREWPATSTSWPTRG